MKITTGICLLLLTSTAWAGTPALEGIVKDAKGNPIKGAEVKIEARTGTFSRTTKTDANGHYFSDGMALGTLYKVDLVVNGSVKASILNASARQGKPGQLNFDLRNTKAPVKTHMVYVPQDIGSHIGGGRWVEVDENGNPVNDNANVDKMGTNAVRQMQNATMNAGASGH
jgi:hypothetical protein